MRAISIEVEGFGGKFFGFRVMRMGSRFSRFVKLSLP